MTNENRPIRRVMLALLVFFLSGIAVPRPARAGDREFGLLVHYVESHYHARRSHRFLLGFACFTASLVARPYGVREMKLALWENGNLTTATGGDADFPEVVRAGLREGWQPMVRVWSQRTGERTVVFAKPEGRDLKLLVATAEHSEAVVVQMRINPDRLSKCIDGWTREDRRHHQQQNDASQLPPMDGQSELETANDSL